jgi:hypothetical protein
MSQRYAMSSKIQAGVSIFSDVKLPNPLDQLR